MQWKHAEVEQIYRTAPIGLCVLDHDLRYVRINDRLAELNGVATFDHIGWTVREIIPTVADALEPILQRVIASGAPVIGLELRGQTAAQPNVERVWIENYVPVRNDRGAVVGVNVSVDEVPRERRSDAQKQRRIHSRALASLLDHAREEERKRIARDLHDELAQVLTAVKLGIDSAAAHVGPDPGITRGRLGELDDLVKTSITSVRRLIEELRPSAIAAPGVAIRACVRQFERTFGIRCTMDVPRVTPALPPAVATALVRICQEALTNVGRHAHATLVEVSLRANEAGCMLEVSDDGKGIATAPLADPDTFGLIGMRERAESVGGRFTVQVRRTGGTVVSVTIPAAG